METIGFCGLGAMGTGMAHNLALMLRSQQEGERRADGTLLIYNRTQKKAEPLLSDPRISCRLVDTLADLAASATIVCVMLADDMACEAMLRDLEVGCKVAEKPLLVINHTTSSPSFSRSAAARVASWRVPGAFLAAPVFGRPDAAAAGKLVVVPAGPEDLQQRAAPFLQALGTLMPAGAEPHLANVVKLTGNFMIGGIIELISEAQALLDKNGISREVLVQFVDRFFPAPPIQGYTRRIAGGQNEPGFTVELAMKDVRYVRNLAEESRVPMPIADTVFQHLLAAAAQGHGNKDWGAISLAVAAAAGLPAGDPADAQPSAAGG